MFYFLQIQAHGLADEAEFLRPAAFADVRRNFFCLDDIPAGDARGLAAELVERRNDLRVDVAVEHVLDDLDRLLVGHAQAVDELGLQPGFAHPLRDRFAAAVDEHGVDADRLEENHVAQHALDDLLVLHRAAAVLDDDGFSAVLLDVRKRFDQRLGACQMGIL